LRRFGRHRSLLQLRRLILRFGLLFACAHNGLPRCRRAPAVSLCSGAFTLWPTASGCNKVQISPGDCALQHTSEHDFHENATHGLPQIASHRP
jgi:hypothetical protein